MGTFELFVQQQQHINAAVVSTVVLTMASILLRDDDEGNISSRSLMGAHISKAGSAGLIEQAIHPQYIIANNAKQNTITTITCSIGENIFMYISLKCLFDRKLALKNLYRAICVSNTVIVS